MKIKMINKDAKKNLTFYQLEELKKEYESQYKEYPISDDLPMFARIYTGEYDAECLSFSAEMAFYRYSPDVLCTGLFRGRDCFVEASFYITDAWQYCSTGENGEELRNRAYIRRYEIVK